MGKPVQQGLFLSSIGAFDLGINSNLPPVSLPPNQLSYAINCTMRGSFVTQRSAWRDYTLEFPNTDVQALFEDALFQGSTFYKPDFGSESLIAAIAGRLFKVVPSVELKTATVTDITPDTENNATNPQAWLWQGENYVFWNDGQSTPVIYNDQTSQRLAAGEVIATIAVGANIAGNASASVTLTAPYTGQYNVPVNVYTTGNQLLGQFQVQAASAGYAAVLTNLNDPPGTVHGAGDLIIPGSYLGHILNGGVFQPGQIKTVNIDIAYTGPVGGLIFIDSITKPIVIAKNATGPTLTIQSTNSAAFQLNATHGFTRYPSVADQTVGSLVGGFTAPAIGGTVTVSLESPYTGADGAVITVDGAQYTISVVAPPASNSVYLLNLYDQGKDVQANYTIRTVPQLPPGRMGVYGNGRIWECLADGLSYLAGDIVGGSSGTIAFNFRDSILNVTENNYLAGGGVFRIPSAGQTISSMRFPATLDSSLGQGPLQVGTQSTIFSCNAPVQRLDWQTLTNPIQTQSLVGGGFLSHYSTVVVNGDIWGRSLDGIRSLKLARQDFVVSYANTPQSVEVNRILMGDNTSLLNFATGAGFDNRLLESASPVQATGGVYHPKLVPFNFDPNSGARQKLPPIWEGSWEGRNVLQMATGTFAGVERLFAFTYNSTINKIGVSELLKTPLPNSTDLDFLYDNGTNRIQWSFETAAIFYNPDTRTRELRKLSDGEIFVKDLVGTVQFKVEFRPDYLSTWTTWLEWEVSDSPNFQPRMGLGTPPITGDDTTGRPNCVGYHFQLKITMLGSCVFMGANLYATTQPVTDIAPPISSTGLTTLVT